MEKISLSKEQLRNFLVIYHGFSKTVFDGSEAFEQFAYYLSASEVIHNIF